MSTQSSEASNLVEESITEITEAVENVEVSKDVEEEIREATEEEPEEEVPLYTWIFSKHFTKQFGYVWLQESRELEPKETESEESDPVDVTKDLTEEALASEGDASL